MTGLVISDLRLRIGQADILNGVSLGILGGEITGLAGESGSGKTMTGLVLCGLQPAGAVVTGRVEFTDSDRSIPNLLALQPREFNRLRGRRIAMVAQDPVASLHPMLTIGTQLTDHVRHHLRLSKQQATARAVELLERVQVPTPETALRRYPHQFSGGQLQRIAIAIAIACEPAVLIADEPTTALDVTVQAGILRLLRELRDDLGLAIILISHDLGVMSAIADTIAVMRYGTVIEQGSRQQVIQQPQTEYARELIAALPQVPPPGITTDAGGQPHPDAQPHPGVQPHPGNHPHSTRTGA